MSWLYRLSRFFFKNDIACQSLSDLNGKDARRVLMSVSESLNIEMDELEELIKKYNL